MAKRTNHRKKTFKLTYSTMFDPPEELHARYERALAKLKGELGREHRMLIDGREVRAQTTFEDTSPINQDWVLGRFQQGGVEHAEQALAAARRAFPAWSGTPWRQRVRLVRKAAREIDRRLYEIGAVISLEVGKSRMEAIGDIAEAADLMRYACDQLEQNRGFVVKMGRDPLKGYRPSNTSVLRPYGVWWSSAPSISRPR